VPGLALGNFFDSPVVIADFHIKVGDYLSV
jgi:hypothetical protein